MNEFVLLNDYGSQSQKLQELAQLQSDILSVRNKIRCKQMENERFKEKLEKKLESHLLPSQQQQFKHTREIITLMRENKQFAGQIHSLKIKEIDPIITKIQNDCSSAEQTLCDFIAKKKDYLVQLRKQNHQLQQQLDTLQCKVYDTRTVLLQSIVKYCRLGENRMFNFKGIPYDYTQWSTQFGPEKVSVLIYYLLKIIRIFLEYTNWCFCRYTLRNDKAIMVDAVFEKEFKLIETDYRMFKSNGSLQDTLDALNAIVLNIHASFFPNQKPNDPNSPLKTLMEIVNKK